MKFNSKPDFFNIYLERERETRVLKSLYDLHSSIDFNNNENIDDEKCYLLFDGVRNGQMIMGKFTL